MRRRRRGVAAPELPIACLLLIVSFFFVLSYLSFERPWLPPFHGRASFDQQVYGVPDWQANVDPRGWDRVLQSSALSEQLGQFHMQLSRGDAQTRDEDRKYHQFFAGSPRLVFQYRNEPTEAWGELFQTDMSPRLLSGPVQVKLPAGLYRGENLGISLGSLKTLPDDIQGLVAVDPRGLRLPEGISQALLEQWKRWEFDPFVDLGGALGDTLCYARWRGKTLFAVDLEDPQKVASELRRRYPDSVIKTLSRRAYGSRITGFELGDKPAWFVRGEQVFGTADGGISYLSRYLYTRLEKDGSLRAQSGLIRELQRLAEGQKGWHVCLIERQADKDFHWALLLNFSQTEPGRAEGFLVVDFKLDKDS